MVWGSPAEREGSDRDPDRPEPRRPQEDGGGRVRRAGRPSTTYRMVEEFEFASRLVVNLQTGRTHQIRVHLAHIGHPVFGDPTYGGRPQDLRGPQAGASWRGRGACSS